MDQSTKQVPGGDPFCKGVCVKLLEARYREEASESGCAIDSPSKCSHLNDASVMEHANAEETSIGAELSKNGAAGDQCSNINENSVIESANTEKTTTEEYTLEASQEIKLPIFATSYAPTDIKPMENERMVINKGAQLQDRFSLDC
ncbi:hypothetical protein DCAR_0623730 [Daucus carota subsp. sativus]|uniref:Uncharacterized protein n=1 Tax=Daucus carota subsp. sativus TaxID=79200 RepID=A0A164VDZ3_DAUCS|nr:hypothetical protein DCAR_0623730 [Daucus carota subsp. sativus]